MATRTTVEELETQKQNNTLSLTSNQQDCKMKPGFINKNLKPGRLKSTAQPMNNDQQGNPDGRHGIQSHDKKLGYQTNNIQSPENEAQLEDNSLSNVPLEARDDHNEQGISKVKGAQFSCERENVPNLSNLTVDDYMPPSVLINTLPFRPNENQNKTDSDFRVDTDGENMSLASLSCPSLDWSILSPELETGSRSTEGINFKHNEVLSEVPFAVVKPTQKCINHSDTNSGASCEQATPKEVIPSALTDPVPSYVNVDGQQSICDQLADLQRIATPAVESTVIVIPAVESTDIATPAVQSTDEHTVRSDDGASSEQTTPTEVLPANNDPDGPQSMVNQDVQEMAAISGPNAGKMSDFVLLHADADIDDAGKFANHLQQEIGIPDVTIDLYGDAQIGLLEMTALSSLHDNYRHILIYVTKNLANDRYKQLLYQILIKIGLTNATGKEDRVVPVFTKNREKEGCGIPTLDVFCGLNYFNFLSPEKKTRYVKSVQRLVQIGRAKFPD